MLASIHLMDLVALIAQLVQFLGQHLRLVPIVLLVLLPLLAALLARFAVPVHFLLLEVLLAIAVQLVLLPQLEHHHAQVVGQERTSWVLLVSTVEWARGHLLLALRQLHSVKAVLLVLQVVFLVKLLL